MIDANQVLAQWYLGELGGHALFSLLAQEEKSEVAHKWNALASIEERVAGHLRIVLASRSISVPVQQEALVLRALERRDSIVHQTWVEKMQWLLAITESALLQIQREAHSLPDELLYTGDLVIRHEVALRSFADREVHNGGVGSLLPIHTFLASTIRD